MKKKNQFWPITCSIVLVIIGIFLLAFPDISDFVDSTNNILYVVMYIYAAIKLVQYCFSKNPGDYEDLFMCMASVIAGTSGIIFSLEDTTKVLSLTLFGWLILVSVIKLIKIDYLIQQKNSMFNVKIVLFSAFVLAGLLSCINIFYAISNQTIMLGFFFLINGLLELAYPLIENYHLSHLKDEEAIQTIKEPKETFDSLNEIITSKEEHTKKKAIKKVKNPKKKTTQTTVANKMKQKEEIIKKVPKAKKEQKIAKSSKKIVSKNSNEEKKASKTVKETKKEKMVAESSKRIVPKNSIEKKKTPKTVEEPKKEKTIAKPKKKESVKKTKTSNKSITEKTSKKSTSNSKTSKKK